MCTVSIAEFNNNPAKYMKIAKQETVVITGDGETFELVKKEVFISGAEAKKRVHSHIDKLFAENK